MNTGRHGEEKEKLNVPADFTVPAVSRKAQKNLMPPSHFISTTQATSSGAAWSQGTAPSAWMNPAPDLGSVDPWAALSQAQREIQELRMENRRATMRQGDTARAESPVDHPTRSRTRMGSLCEEGKEQRSGRDAEWRAEVERQRVEMERLRGQLEARREMEERRREERRNEEKLVTRRGNEMEALRAELIEAKAELGTVRLELIQHREEKEKLSSQLERLERESGGEVLRLRWELQRSRQEAQELALETEKGRHQAEEEARQHTVRLAAQLEESQKRLEAELQRINATHSGDLANVKQTNSELQDRLQAMSSETVQLRSRLADVSSERDGLEGQLSQVEQALEAQSATVQSLRNYIGQLSPESGERERLNETVERLNKEKKALQMTTELLSIRLNSVNEILSLQEEKMTKKSLGEPLLQAACKGTDVLRLWRQKVFMLCVQLRSKDLELRAEKDHLLSSIRSLEQQVEQEQHQTSLLQHSLKAREAELDQEKLAREAVQQDLSWALRDSEQLKSRCETAEAELTALTEAVKRLGVVFEAKVTEVEAAQTRLTSFTQRLTFAKRRVETIQGLMMRSVALRKVQEATKSTDQAADSAAILSLRAEVALMCEERDKLTEELKRTPELIEKALADIREQSESKVRQQQEAWQQVWQQAQEAESARQEAQQRLQELQAQLEDSTKTVEELCSELRSQQKDSELALQKRMSETEHHCSEQLREMEAQLNTARREHTKAVMALRQFERHAERKRNQEREASQLQSESTKREVENLHQQLKDMEREKTLLLATIQERGLLEECKRARTAALQSSAALQGQGDRPPRWTTSVETRAKPFAKESLVSVLGDLQALSAAVVISPEDSEEDEQSQGAGPSTPEPHS